MGYEDKIEVGQITVGDKESSPRAFEDATVDMSNLNENLKHNAAFNYEIHPDAVINSCSQCCMEKVNGEPNILGMLHRAKYTRVDGFGHKHLDCGSCPITKDNQYMPARDGNGDLIKDADGRPVSQAELVRMETDNTK